MKCPYCGSLNINEIIPNPKNPDVSFVITEMIPKTNTFISNSGLAVHAFGCNDCNGIMFKG